MHASTRRRALRAAAQVALSCTALGCGGHVEITSEDGESPTPETTPEPVPTPDPPPGYTADIEPEPPPPVLPPPPELREPETLCAVAQAASGTTASALSPCCVDALEAALPSDSGQWSFQRVDATLRACCSTVIANFTWGRGVVPSLHFEACCQALSFPQGTACTPWGPPVPPAVPEGWIA